MPVYLQIDSLTKSYGDRLLFADVTFGINEGDKIGLIAKNGTGKSTLLRIIAGEEEADSGSVISRNGLHVAYLPQTPRFEGCHTVMDIVESSAVPEGEMPEDYQARLTRMLSQLKITDLTKSVETLSGGELKRIALAIAFVGNPDLLILDEPTNHLDIDAIEWMEGYLRKSRVAILLVTHDRYFLDRVCNSIIEIDRGELFAYAGNYDYYLKKRKERINALTGELAKIKNTLRREQEWMSRQPQARAGKAKFRINAFHELKSRSRMDLQERDVALNVKASYIGSKIFEAEGLTKKYGEKIVLDDFTYTFARYDKVGIIGPNGVGKSTFIKLLQGIEKGDAGSIAVGETVKFGYYSQSGIDFDENKRVIDAVTEIAEDIVVNDSTHFSPMQFLQRFLFSPADCQKYIRTLSGGERARLHLATVLMRSPNFLILDEPTNNLDIITLSILEDYLSEFKGCVIVVSHDRYFLDNIAEHLFVFTGNGIVKDFPGTYSEYRSWQLECEAEERCKAALVDELRNHAKFEEPKARKRKLSYRERIEFEQLQEEIDRLTEEKKNLEAIFSSGESRQDAAAISSRYQQIIEELDIKELRWLELAEIEEAR